MIHTNEYITIDTNAGLISFNTDVQPGTIVLKFTKPTDEDTWCFLRTTDFSEAGLEQTATDIFPNSTDIFRQLPEAMKRGLVEENPYKQETPRASLPGGRLFDRNSFKRGKGNASSSRWGK